MKITPTVKAFLSAFVIAALPVTSFAQSSLTLYGVLDEGLNYVTNSGGHSLTSVSSSYLQGSRWGLRGVEDLGSGYQAVFALEGGLDISTGKSSQGGLQFGRQAYVGIATPYGTVSLGRQYDAVVDTLAQWSASNQWASYFATHAGDIDNLTNSWRSNNSIKFKSVEYLGFGFSALYSLGGVAGDASRNQIFSLGGHYRQGPLYVGVGYTNARDPNISFFGNSSTSTVTAATTNEASRAYSGYASARTYQDVSAGAVYSFGKAQLSAFYSNTQFRSLGDLSAGPNPYKYQGNAIFDTGELSFKYSVTPAFLVGVAYTFTRNRGVDGQDGAHYNQGSLGADYFLSKTTDVYVVGAYQRASGRDSTGAAAVATLGNLTASDSASQAVVRVGLRHKF